MVEIANVTVAVATLNRPDDLKRCLGAVLSGRVLPAELIVVDQSRDDSTQTLMDKWQARGTNVPIIYLKQEQRGLSASRNAALARAHHPVIAFTDDDCVPDSCWIAAIDCVFTGQPALDAVSGRVLPLGPSEPGTFSVSPREGDTPINFKGKAIPWLVGTGGNVAMKKEWFERVGGFDERLGAGTPGRAAEDADMLYRLLCAGAHIRYEPTAIVHHQRQTREQRLASRWNYGHGIGAFCGIWLRRGDRYALRALGYWLFSLTRELAGDIAHRDAWQVRQRLLSLRGTASGLAYGLVLPTLQRRVA